MIDEQRLQLAWTLLDTGRPERALEELTPLLAAAPDRPDLLVLAAQASALAGDLGEARELAGRAVARAPEDLTALLVLSQVEAASARSTRAARAARAAVRLAPDAWRAHAQVVRVDVAAGSVHRTTLAAADAMLRLAPQQPEALALAGALAALRHRPRTAEGHFRAALAIDSGYGPAQEGLARLSAGRLRYRAAAETAAGRLAVDPTDRVGRRLLDSLTARLVLPALIGPPFLAFATWRALRPSDLVPQAEWATRTIAADYPLLLLPPAALLVWVLLQTVLVHRATRGTVWQDLRALPGGGIGAAMAVIGAATVIAFGLVAGVPVPIARTVLLIAASASVLALVAPLLRALLRRRPSPADRRPSARTGRPGALTPEVRTRLLVGLALLAGPIAPAAALFAAGRADEYDHLLLGPALLEARPWTGGAVALSVLCALLLLVGASAVARGSALGRIAWSRWSVIGAALAVLSVAATVLALLQPVRLGGLLIALILTVWTAIGVVVALVRTRAQRLARR